MMSKQDQDNPFGNIVDLLVQKKLLSDDQARRQTIASLTKRTSHVKKSFKTVNELIALIREEPFFKPIKNNIRVITQICQRAQYRHHRKGQNLYTIGERGHYFYLILSGKIHLTVPEEIQVEDILRQIGGLKRQETNSFLQMQNPFKRSITQPEVPKVVLNSEKIVQMLEAGDTFGELESGLRETNAVLVDDCELLCLNGRAYQGLLSAQLKTQNQKRYLFLKQMPIFDAVSIFTLSRLSLLMQEQNLTYNQSLFRSGDIIDKIYVILNGSFKLSRKLNRRSLAVISPKFEYKRIIDDRRDGEFLVVQKGEVLGDCQVFSQQQHYQESCTCESQQAVVLSINVHHFMKILMEDEKGLEAAKEASGSKNKWKRQIVNSFVERRTRNSFMNSYLQDPRKMSSSLIKKKEESIKKLKREVKREDFFYNQFNKSIMKSPNSHRFSKTKDKCKTEAAPIKNLFAIKTENKQKVPHGVQDIVELVRLKNSFQRRFRKGKKTSTLFKFDESDAPMYIKSRFNKLK